MAVSVPAAPRTQERSAFPRSPVAPPRPAHGEPLWGLDVAVEATLGADLRLIYGLGVPVLAIVALMIPMFLFPSIWLDLGVLAVTVAAVGFIVTKVLQILAVEPDDATLDPALEGLPA